MGQKGNAMNHQLCSSNRAISALVTLVTCAMTPQLHGNDVRTQVDGEAHAKGVVLLRVTFSSKGEVWSVRLDTSRDGEEFREAGIGLPRAYKLFRSIANDQKNTSVLVPAIAWFRTEGFFFDEPGTYWFRWGISFRNQEKPRTVPDQRDPNIEAVVVDQIVEVEPPTQADLDFIAGLGGRNLMRAMAGEDFFERQTGDAIEHVSDPEVRAVGVIGRLLYATREGWVGDIMRVAGPRGDARNAAEMLLNLAKEIPESSYAPYAAYYTGCCYYASCFEEAEEAVRSRNKEVEFKSDLAQGKYRVAQLKRNPDTVKAYEAFTLAAQRADDYLKPRVLYQHGTMRLSSLDFDEAEQLLTEASRVVPGERRLQKWFDKKFGGIEHLHGKLEKAKARFQGDEDSASDTPTP